MKIKRIKSIKINSYNFKVAWDKSHGGGWFNYGKLEINIGVKNRTENEILMILHHELMEIVACEMNVRFDRPDCDSDYMFVYDHRQHETMMNMLSGLIAEFL